MMRELEDTGAFYRVIPQTEAEFKLQRKENAEAKARYCKRQRHLNATPIRIGGVYVALCAECRVELDNHLLDVIDRHSSHFKVVEK